MKQLNIKAIGAALLSAAATFASASLTAATIEMNGSDGFGQSSWNTGTHWSGGAKPVAGNDYVVPSGKQLRTPNDANCGTFAGDSLTINGSLALKNWGNSGDWVYAKKWILGAGGSINIAQWNREYNIGAADVPMTINGTVANPSCLRISGNNSGNSTEPRRRMWIHGKMSSDSGAKILVLRSDDDADWGNDFNARVKFTADNSNYKGAFEISRIPSDSSKPIGRGWCYYIDFGQNWVPGGSEGVSKTMGAGVDSGTWLTLGHQTVLFARGMPFTSRYPLQLGNATRGDDGGDARIDLYGSHNASLSGRHGNESVWFGNGAKITGSGASVLSIASGEAGQSYAAAFGDVTITDVAKIKVDAPATLRFYPGYNNPDVAVEANTSISDEADGIGAVTLKDGGFLSPGFDTQGIGTMGLAALTMEEGSFLYYSAKPASDGSTTNDFIRITGNLVNSTGGKIKIGFDAPCTSMKMGDKIALLSAANLGDAGVTANDFELDNTVYVTDESIGIQLTGTFSIETIGGAKTLVFTQTSRQVVALVGKDTKGQSCFAAASSSSGAAYWSNKAKPDADHDYIIPSGTLLRVNSGYGTSSSQTFAGHSLSIRKGGEVGLDNSHPTFSDLRLCSGGTLSASSDWGQSINGNAMVCSTAENPFVVKNADSTRKLYFNEGMTAKGTGDIRFYLDSNSSYDPKSTTFMNWDATGFTGGMVITGRACRVSFKNEKAMGGPAPEFRYDRLRIEGNGKIQINAAYTMGDMTRGIYIGGGVSSVDQGVGGTFDVINGPFVISNIISGATMLRKTGSGTMKICCPSNTFSGTVALKNGSLWICHRDALAKAAKIQCYDGTTTWYIDTPDGMTVSSKDAFCRSGDTAKFNVRLTALDSLEGTSSSWVDVPIFRVKGATLADAEAIEAWINLVNVPSRWKWKFKAVESDGELIVSARFSDIGLMIMIR